MYNFCPAAMQAGDGIFEAAGHPCVQRSREEPLGETQENDNCAHKAFAIQLVAMHRILTTVFYRADKFIH